MQCKNNCITYIDMLYCINALTAYDKNKCMYYTTTTYLPIYTYIYITIRILQLPKLPI